MVATLQRLLVDETGLLEQVDDHVGSRQLTRGVEIDTDELSKPIKELSILLVDFKHITTISYIVEGHLTSGIAPLRNLVLARYPGFLQKLLSSPSREVSIMAEVALKDARTITASNARMLTGLTGIDCSMADKFSMRSLLPIKEVPESERWRLGLLDALLEMRTQQEKEGVDTRRVVAMLSSLCTS